MTISYSQITILFQERYMSEENKSKSTPGDRIYDKVNRHTDMVIDSVKETIESIKKEVMTELYA